MLKILRRWATNINWLLNHPPTGMIRALNPPKCEYCDDVAWFDFRGEWGFCESCLKKAMDKALKPKK